MSSWVCPPIVAVLKLKVEGFASSVLIADHIHIGLGWGSRGFALENCRLIYYVHVHVKSIKIKVMTQHFNMGT